MIRGTFQFPLLFGATLIVIIVGFYNRRKLFPEVEEIKRKKATQRRQEAIEFKQKVADGVRERRAAREKKT